VNAIVLRGIQSATIEIDTNAADHRDELVCMASEVVRVDNDAEAIMADTVLSEIAKLKKEVEASRKLVKGPVDKLADAIQETARNFVADVVAQDDRIRPLLAAYRKRQADKAAAEEAERRRKLEEIERQRQEELRAAQEEAERKAKAEREAANSEAERQAAEKRAADERERIEAEAKRKAAEARREVTLSAPAPVKQASSLRQVPKFQVVDAQALVAARPDLVNVVPKAAEINRLILAGTLDIPGLKCWIDDGLSVKA